MSGRGDRSAPATWRLLPVIAIFPAALVIIFLMSGSPASEVAGTPDWAGVEQAVGTGGSVLPDGTFLVTLPRDDVQIRVGNVSLEPEMAVDAWVAFTRMDGEAMMMGDLTLTTEELWTAQDLLLREGIDITAIHNTLNNETPQVFDLHVSGTGDPVKMAQAVANALKAAGVTYTVKTASTTATEFPGKSDLDRIMGIPGQTEGRVLEYRIPRAGTVTANGMALSPYMDVATQIKFQPLAGNSAAASGEFVLTASETRPVIKALNDKGIRATALHTHMLDENPRLYYLHYWAVGDRVALAKGLREAVEQTDNTVTNSPATVQRAGSD